MIDFMLLHMLLKNEQERKKSENRDESFLKWRIKCSIAAWRKEPNKIAEFRRGNMKLGDKNQMRMGHKYQLTEKVTLLVIC